ncbi:hypothetical protein CAPTEDRAFT_188419 [Capitella teleta]|uniref:Uncharacterized protein n=1 Tax=Capitella teleta TaxID=283909 RepID=R7UEF4_CAPTE|nr:hypothetical protein CAPTEDRAFT_188419 [Capitella teleta]|eukprot:ELU02173.1 hypothetical protein CAPTEDRAFT_188419 [Capitella teleta]
MAAAINSNRSRDFWSEVRKVNSRGNANPNVVDGIEGEEEICQHFRTASHLLESVKAEYKTEQVLTEEVVEEQVVEEQIVETNTVPLEEPYHEVIEEAEVELGQEESVDVKDMSSVEQLVQNKRTILVETVMVNGQKVKIVRMAPAGAGSSQSMAPPTAASKRTRVARNPPKVTILRNPRPAQSQAQVVVNPMDLVFDEVPQHQVLEETVEQEVEVSHPGEQYSTAPEQGQELVITEQHSYVPQELSQMVQEGVPAQIFEQDEGSSIQVQELDPDMVMDEQVILQPGEQEILEDENGVQYVQVFNSETGQHEHIVLEHQVV